MKRILFSVWSMLVCLVAFGQTNVTVGGNTLTSTSTIINRSWGSGTASLNSNYSIGEILYTKAEIGVSGGAITIDRIAFNKTGGSTTLSTTPNVSIYMKTVSATTIASGTYNLATYTLVWSGTFPSNGAYGFKEVILTNTYSYANGVNDNLSILVLNNSGSITANNNVDRPGWGCNTVSGSDVRSRFATSSSALPTFGGSSTTRPQVRLRYTSCTAPTAGITNNTGTTVLTCTTTAISVTGTGGSTYSWSGVTGTGANRSLTSAANYVVTVTAACGATASASINITSNTTAPSASISPATATICNGASIGLTASGGGTYNWSNSLGAGASKTVSPTTGTTYTVTVTGSNGCTATANRLVTVNPLATSGTLKRPDNTAIVNGSTLSICAGSGITALNDVSPTNGGSGTLTVVWYSNLGDFSGTWKRSTDNTTALFSAVGAANSTSLTNYNPQLDFPGGTSFYILRRAYTSNCGEGVLAPTAQYIDQGFYLTLNPLPAATISRTPTGPQFTGIPLTLTANPTGGTAPYTYSWSSSTFSNPGIAAGTFSSTTAQTVSVTPTNGNAFNAVAPAPSLQYSVLVTDNNGCTVSQINQPTIYPNIQAPQGTTTRCQGSGTSTFTTGSSAATPCSGTVGFSAYEWSLSPLAAGSISSAGVVTWNSTYSGTATVSVRALGCGSSATVGTQNSAIQSTQVIVNDLPVVTATNGGPYVTGQNIQLNSTPNGATTYAWSGPAAYSIANTQNPLRNNALLTYAGLYSVTVTDANGCTGTDNTTVVVTPPCTSGTWTGLGTNNLWDNANNWSCLVVPNSTIDVNIPNTSNDPVVPGVLVSATTKSLLIETDATLTIDGTLSVHGNFTNSSNTIVNGDGKLVLTGNVASQTITGNLNVEELELNNPNGAALATGSNVNIGTTLILTTGVLNVTSGNLTLKSDATGTAYVDDFNDATGATNANTGITGNLTIERYIKPATNVNYQSNYHYVGSIAGLNTNAWTDDFANGGTAASNTPVTPTPNCSVTNLATGSAFGNLFRFDEPNITDCSLRAWEVMNTGTTIERGRGYAARINDPSVWVGGANRTLDETGSYFNNANVTLTLTRTAANVATSILSSIITRGEHLLSNPYFAPVSWEAIKAASADVNGTAYRFKPNSGNFEPVNNLSLNKNFSTNEGFVVIPLNNTLTSNYTVSIPNTARRAATNNVALRQQPLYAYGMKITVNANNVSDEALIVFDNTFTEGYDDGYDAKKMMSVTGVPSIFIRDAATNNEANCILALPEATAVKTIPLGVKIEYNGTHEFTFEGLSDFPNTSIVWLEDLTTGTIQYLKQNNTYSFTANKTDNADRFLLHFAPEMLITATQANCANENGSISLEERGGLNWSYELVDNNNTTVSQNANFSGNQTIAQLPSGTYTLNLNHTASGYQTTETVTIQQVATVAAEMVADNTTVNAGDMVTVDISNTTGATNTTIDMGDGTVYNNEAIVNHIYTTGGTYTVTLNANNDNCADAASLQIRVEDLTTSIADTDTKGIKVYANQNELYVEQLLEKGDIKAKVDIYNMLGQIVTSVDITATYKVPSTIILTDVAKGTYIAQVTANKKTVSKRIVVSE